jgi:hypothetical protein
MVVKVRERECFEPFIEFRLEDAKPVEQVGARQSIFVDGWNQLNSPQVNSRRPHPAQTAKAPHGGGAFGKKKCRNGKLALQRRFDFKAPGLEKGLWDIL